MPRIFELGDQFWMESFQITASIPDVAGFFDSALTVLEKAGEILAVSCVPVFTSNNTNSQGVGNWFVRSNLGTLNIGDKVVSLGVRTQKQAGTGTGSVTYLVIAFLRRPAV